LILYAEAHQLLGAREGLERRSVVRVLPLGKGEYREPGLQENSVRNFTGRRGPLKSAPTAWCAWGTWGWQDVLFALLRFAVFA